MSNMKFAITIRALDAFTKPMRGMENGVKAFSEKSTQALGRVADTATINKERLGGIIKPLQAINKEIRRLEESTGFSKAFASAKSNLGTVTKLSATLSTIVAKASLIAQTAEKFETLAESVGISGKTLAGWEGAIGGAGFQAEHIIDAFEKMGQKFGELENVGTMSVAEDSLKMLGIRFKDIRKLAPEKQFALIMEKATSMENQGAAFAATDMLFGGEASKILGHMRMEMNKTGKSLQEILQEKEALYTISKEGREGNRILARSTLDFVQTTKFALWEVVGIIGKHLAPILDRITRFILENMPTIRTYVSMLAEKISTFFTGTDTEIENLLDSIGGASAVFLRLVKHIGNVRTVLIALGAVIADPILTSVAMLTIAFAQMSIALTANPIGLIIMGIVAIIVGLIATVYYFKDAFITAWESIQVSCSSFMEWFRAIDLTTIGRDIFHSLWKGFSSVWESISNWITEKIAWLTNIMPDWVKEKLGITVEGKIQEGVGNTQKNTTNAPFVSVLPKNMKQQVGGKISIKFDNAPKEMRVQAQQSEGGIVLNTDIGYNNTLIY